MCIKAAEKSPRSLTCVPDRFRTQEMSVIAGEAGSWQQCHVPDHFKVQEMCDKAVRKGPFPLQYVPDSFVTQQQIKIWHDGSEYHDKDRLIEWYDGYKNAGH